MGPHLESAEALEEAFVALFGGKRSRQELEACRLLLDKVLNPRFNVFATWEDQLAAFHRNAEKVLTVTAKVGCPEPDGLN